MRRIRAIVSGRVQGVAYRASTEAKARQLGLAGWVRNLPDGRVELEAEGPPEQVAALVTWCHHGPPSARVDQVAVEELAPKGDEDFDVRY
jgi:acylphosphatase